MARVEDWYWRWVARLQDRILREDWPAEDSLWWKDIKADFVRHGVEEYVADEAVRNLRHAPPPHLDRFPSALILEVKNVWKSSECAPEMEGSREQLERACRDCDECAGSGVTVRWRHETAGQLDSAGRPLPASVTFYCHRCPMGRWLERNHREKSPEIRRRFADLQDFPRLWDDVFRVPPNCPSPPTDPKDPQRRLLNVWRTRKLAMQPQTTIAAAMSEPAPF